LKVLDYQRITKTERERADRLANSAAGAALESDVQDEGQSQQSSATKTFTPGEGTSAEESFVVNFTKEEKERIREMIANAKSPTEIEEIERSVKRGIFPNIPGYGDGNHRKRPPPGDQTNDSSETTTTKKQKT
jgi:hypothetical protein